MPLTQDPDRSLLIAAGPDSAEFLQGLLSNDVKALEIGQACYAALLTPQGKYLADFFVIRHSEDAFWLDVPAQAAPDLLRRLTLYKLRSKVTLTASDTPIALCWERDCDQSALVTVADPRDAGLGWRLYGVDLPTDPQALTAYHAMLIVNGLPRHGADLLPEESFILQAGFERARGVDFRKGCYVGQEVTARMRHKAELTKKLFRLHLAPEAAEVVKSGDPVLADGKRVGQLGAKIGEEALAILRSGIEGDAEVAGYPARITPI
ncbi:MAG: folate-binding protein [Neomegalonema sp.]|nr:folate-binding protein [Neomegalonema sp.]